MPTVWGTDFFEKPKRRLGEGLDHVKVELTFQLRKPRSQSTDQRDRTVKKTAKTKRQSQQRQPQRQSPRLATPPPTNLTAPAPTPAILPATVTPAWNTRLCLHQRQRYYITSDLPLRQPLSLQRRLRPYNCQARQRHNRPPPRFVKNARR